MHEPYVEVFGIDGTYGNNLRSMIFLECNKYFSRRIIESKEMAKLVSSHLN